MAPRDGGAGAWERYTLINIGTKGATLFENDVVLTMSEAQRTKDLENHIKT